MLEGFPMLKDFFFRRCNYFPMSWTCIFVYYYGQCDGLAGIRTQSAKKSLRKCSDKFDAKLDELYSPEVTK